MADLEPPLSFPMTDSADATASPSQTWSTIYTVNESSTPDHVVPVDERIPQRGGNGTGVPLAVDASKGRGTGVSGGGGDVESQRTGNTLSVQDSHDGRLSNGAIAGIAVGASLAFILLVAGLAWRLLRRRRQKQRAAGRLASQTSVEDKDMHAAPVADSPPRSPYSHEEPSLQGRNPPISPLAAASHGEAGVAALHSSHSGAGAGAGEHDDHAQTQRGVPKTVAHLVEEGMTAEEIRRLEDEERQLDAEIERAARR
ncbi:hypothetical protein G6O67_006977 [Ophiocordyceps sinensis]|uniref:Uncharacterized protein n=2 Tax=Ophiocordyceps sinensis TaxID=72228 RepID=A0A8H4LSV5_9HYPO|nr:hypothetical protein OCS_00595 [Ophiocordyceps sinensis CO18]KAF4504975.1 hypothetical protein G6O67_006977 [Ophiocordyceps sinensis]